MSVGYTEVCLEVKLKCYNRFCRIFSDFFAAAGNIQKYFLKFIGEIVYSSTSQASLRQVAIPLRQTSLSHRG